MSLLNRPLTSLAAFACEVYYRQARLGGAVPETGPVLLVGNHPNGLVDPVLLAATTRRPVRFLSKAPLFDMPIMGAMLRGLGALPVYRAMDGADTADNRDTFDAVFAALARDEMLCLFPEGLSHSEPQLERLKTGAARMALGAEQRADYTLGVRVVPVGLVYRNKRGFRSWAATWVGEPIDAGSLADLHRRDERAAVRTLTERIAEGLQRVTLNLERWEDLPLLELVERIWRPGEGRRVERLSRLAQGLSRARREHPKQVATLIADLTAFGDRLDRISVRASDLELRYTPGRLLGFAGRNLLAVLLGLPLAFLGTTLWWLPYRLSPPLGRLYRPEPEILATANLIAALVVFPIWYLALCGLAWALGGPLAGLAWALLAPLLGLFGLAFWERRAQAMDDLAVFVRLGLQKSLKQQLVRQRDALAGRIEALQREFARG